MYVVSEESERRLVLKSPTMIILKIKRGAYIGPEVGDKSLHRVRKMS